MLSPRSPGKPTGKSSPKNRTGKAEPLMAAAALEMQGINHGGSMERCGMLVPPPFSANVIFAGGMKKIINFKKIKREQL